MLKRNNVLLLKFFLHVSKKEQRKRFLERLDNPEKNWKFSQADLRERGFGTTIKRRTKTCSTPPAPRRRPGT